LPPNLFTYINNLTSGNRTAAFATAREQKLKQALENGDALRKVLASRHLIVSVNRAAFYAGWRRAAKVAE
jgi:hypothetical protein